MTVHRSHSGGDREIRAAKAGSPGRQFYREQHPVWTTKGEEGDCSPRALPGGRGVRHSLPRLVQHCGLRSVCPSWANAGVNYAGVKVMC